MKVPNTFGVWGNTEKDSFWNILPDILHWADDNNLEAHLTRRIKNSQRCINKKRPLIQSKDDMSALDFMLVLGGDGTFLSLARSMGNKSTPILGIHLGDLGFLAKVTRNDLFSRLNLVLKGEFIIEKRMLVQATIRKNGEIIPYVGLNDFVLSNGESHRMLTATVKVNQQLVCNYKADGLIIASPTGSTAYSLSAGGPIVTPSVDSLIITPASAHSLTSRPLVVPANSSIVLSFPEVNDSILFTADGQIHEFLDPKCIVEITKSNFKINLIDFDDCDYFQTLRTKMGWGKRGETS